MSYSKRPVPFHTAPAAEKAFKQVARLLRDRPGSKPTFEITSWGVRPLGDYAHRIQSILQHNGLDRGHFGLRALFVRIQESNLRRDVVLITGTQWHNRKHNELRFREQAYDPGTPFDELSAMKISGKRKCPVVLLQIAPAA